MQLTAADAGCWVDGHWGQYGSLKVIQIAQEFGLWPDETFDNENEFIHEIADEAEQWMNENVAPDGHSFGWFDGEWFLWTHETWEDQ